MYLYCIIILRYCRTFPLKSSQMDESNAEERTEIVPIIGHNRRTYRKQIVVHLILASIMFESTAFYIIDINLPLGINYNETTNWTPEHARIPTYMFNGKLYIKCSIPPFSMIGIVDVSLLIFGIICDAKVRRGKMILIGSVSFRFELQFDSFDQVFLSIWSDWYCTCYWPKHPLFYVHQMETVLTLQPL